MTQKRLMTSFKLITGQKMFKFWKVTSENFKNPRIGKLPNTLGTSKFSKVIGYEF